MGPFCVRLLAPARLCGITRPHTSFSAVCSLPRQLGPQRFNPRGREAGSEGHVAAASLDDLQGSVYPPALLSCAIGSSRHGHCPRVRVAFWEAEGRVQGFTDAPHHGPRGGQQERAAPIGARHVAPSPIPGAPLGVRALSTLERADVTEVLRNSTRASTVRKE